MNRRFALLNRDVDDFVRPGAIARRENVRRARLHFVVCDDAAVFRFHAGVFQAERRRVRHAAQREQNFLGGNGNCLPSCSNETVFNFPLRFASKSFVPVKTRMPSRRKTFSISVPASASNSFKMCSLRWINVTLTPKRAKNCANSHAIAPPPRMMSDFGSFFSATASSLVMKPTSFSCGSGGGATREPVAMTKCFAV